MFFNYKTFLIGSNVDLNLLGIDKRNRCIRSAYVRATKVTSAIRLALIHTMQSKYLNAAHEETMVNYWLCPSTTLNSP